MNIIETILKNKLIFFIIVILLFFTFSKSTCNGKTGYGMCYTQGDEVIHLSPLNLFLS